MALAGGVSITFPQKRDYLYQEGAMVSADGTCRVFDADAQGTVFGHGVAVVLLKRMADAVADGDNVLGVIKGTALNNDGSAKIGYAAPSVNAQADVIKKALAAAGASPESVSYIEAHGTATPLGDPVEVAALTQAFRAAGAGRNGYCAIGTCKTNIGHIDVAAGATGLIKTILQLQHKQIPPLLHFKAPNPAIDFENSPFFPVTELLEWKRGAGPRRAGVSAFGVGGTNAHVVVEEAPPFDPVGPSRPQQLLVLSAQTESALNAMSANLAAHIEAHPEIELADAAFTLQNGRKQFAHRRAVVASNARDGVDRLRSLESKTAVIGKAMAQSPSVVFLFPGQGAQYPDMGRSLYEEEAVFREQVDRCADILKRHLGLDLRSVLYADTAEPESAETRINQTRLAQPAIFVIEYSLARLWMSWGVKPAVLIGHSIGEYVAAVLAESFTLEDALALLAERARLMQALPAGSMLTVRLSASEVEPYLPEGASIAAINSPVLCVVSGPSEKLKGLKKKFDARGIASKFLHTSHAFHSAMMDPMLSEFAAVARQTPGQPPGLPWVSTLSGQWIRDDDLTGGDYWVRQVRQTVRFADALDSVIGDAQNILLEVGPGQTLSQLARQHAKKTTDTKIIASLGPVGEPERDFPSMLDALGRLWVAGVQIDWEMFSKNEKRRRLPLPTYPFEKKRFWIEPTRANASAAAVVESADQGRTDTQQTEEIEMQPDPVQEIVSTPPRKERLVNELRELIAGYSGADHSQTEPDESFMDLGLDSLLLTQVSQGVLKRFGQKVTFRQLLEASPAFWTKKCRPRSRQNQFRSRFRRLLLTLGNWVRQPLRPRKRPSARVPSRQPPAKTFWKR
jgi:acyl transferase domain-containing protein